MTGYRVRSDIQLPLPTAIWVLAAHAIALFIPFVLIVAVKHHWAALQELTGQPPEVDQPVVADDAVRAGLRVVQREHRERLVARARVEVKLVMVRAKLETPAFMLPELLDEHMRRARH